MRANVNDCRRRPARGNAAPGGGRAIRGKKLCAAELYATELCAGMQAAPPKQGDELLLYPELQTGDEAARMAEAAQKTGTG